MWFWLRRLVRRHSRPIPLTTAEKWNFRLSVFYGIVVWNAAGYIIYTTLTGKEKFPELYNIKKDEDELLPPAERFANLLGFKKAHIIQMTGFTKVNEYEIDRTSEEKDSDSEKS